MSIIDLTFWRSKLLSYHQKFLPDNLRRGRPFSHEGEFEATGDPLTHANR